MPVPKLKFSVMNNFSACFMISLTPKRKCEFYLQVGYMEMVSILLMFIRAQRDGLWELHFQSFRSMLPFFLRYDHYNYGVYREFEAGNFVVKGSHRSFSQVSPDQAQEWLNGTGKKGGGIVGITKTKSALSHWALSYNLRSQIAAETRELLHVNLDESAHLGDKKGIIMMKNPLC